MKKDEGKVGVPVQIFFFNDHASRKRRTEVALRRRPHEHARSAQGPCCPGRRRECCPQVLVCGRGGNTLVASANAYLNALNKFKYNNSKQCYAP